jgi:hypothetical protein
MGTSVSSLAADYCFERPGVEPVLLPDLVHGREGTVRDHVTVPPEPTEDGALNIYSLTPERVRHRTTEEREELRLAKEQERGRRYRAIYDLLGLKVVAQRDGTLEVSGAFGLREMRRGGEPESVWKAVTGEGADDLPLPDDPSWRQDGRCPELRSPRAARSPQRPPPTSLPRS